MARSDLLHGIAVKPSRSGEPHVFKLGDVAVIERLQQSPELYEFFVLLAVGVLVDMIPESVDRFHGAVLAPEAAYHIELFGGEIVGRDLAQTFHVFKQSVGIHQIAVNVVEVADKHVGPEQEVVKFHLAGIFGQAAVAVEEGEEHVVASGFGEVGE